MLDIKRIRQNPQELRDGLKARNKDISIDEFLAQDEKRRALMAQVEEKKALRNAESKKIGEIKKRGGSDEEVACIMEEMRKVGDEIAAFDADIAELEAAMDAFLMTVPNFPHESVPLGKDDHDNVEKRRWGTPREFGWTPKAHWDIGTDLGILDFDTAAKVSGARFTFYRGLGARLERAIINFFLNTHVENGYDEVYPPYMVTRATMTGTGQLPKFEMCIRDRALTVGVLSRVEQLADRAAPAPLPRPFESLIPLPEVLADCLGAGPPMSNAIAYFMIIVKA